MNKRLFLLFLWPAVLAACAYGYQARGTLSDVPGELRGKGYPGNTAGGGRFTLFDKAGGLQCDGIMAPPEAAPLAGSCDGEAGHGMVSCTDGRQLPVRWTALSCRAFQGTGEDGHGNRLQFRVERQP